MLFLGGSQTFIGILASLIVLCVILDKSNFIHNILDEIGKQINDEIKNLDSTVEIEVINDVPEKSDYKLLRLYIDKLNENKDKDPEAKRLFNAAAAMDMKLQATFDQLKSGYSPKFLKPAHDLIGKIQDSKEQVIAPLYALLFCLAIFICDEIVVGIASASNFVVSFLTIFTIFSFLFWIMIWGIFYKDIRIVTECVSSSTIEKSKKSLKHRLIKWRWMYLVIPVFYALCLFISTLVPIMLIKWLIAFMVGFILPICFIASFRAKAHHVFGLYTYEYIFKHFVGLLLMSLLIAAVTTAGCVLSEDISSACFTFENFVVLKISVISFILISGLLLPFLMPYYGFKRVLKIVENEVINSKTNMKDELASVKKELNDFCRNIPLT